MNDDDLLDDECPSDFNAVEESPALPSDIAKYTRHKLCDAIEDELGRVTDDVILSDNKTQALARELGLPEFLTGETVDGVSPDDKIKTKTNN